MIACKFVHVHMHANLVKHKTTPHLGIDAADVAADVQVRSVLVALERDAERHVFAADESPAVSS